MDLTANAIAAPAEGGLEEQDQNPASNSKPLVSPSMPVVNSVAALQVRNVARDTLLLFAMEAYFAYMDWVHTFFDEQLKRKDNDNIQLFAQMPECIARAVFPPQLQPSQARITPLRKEEVFLVRCEVFAKYTALPSFETLRMAGDLDAYPSQAQLPRYLYVSHKWFSNTMPDSGDGQLLFYLRKHPRNFTHVWMDYCCMPHIQGHPGVSGMDKEDMLRNLDRLILGAASTMACAFNADDYAASGWCFLEGQIMPTDTLVLFSRDGAAPETMKRVARSQRLTFADREDGPLVLTKALTYAHDKASSSSSSKGQLELVRQTVRATLDSSLYAEFQNVFSGVLISRYRTVAIALVRNMREVFVTGGVHALRSVRDERLMPRMDIEPSEREFLEYIMRHPACVTTFAPVALTIDNNNNKQTSDQAILQGFGAPDWTPAKSVDTSKVLESMLSRANTGIEIGFQEEEETIFSFRRVFPRALNIPPMTQIITEADNNMYLSFTDLFGVLLKQTNVDEHTIDDDVDKWTDSPGSPLDVSDYVLFASQHECTSYHVTMQVNGLRIYEPKAFAVRRGPLTDLNMRTRPLFSWKHLDSSEDAILALRNAEFIRASAVSDEEGEVNTFVITNLDEIEPTLAKWEGWALFSLLIEMGSSIKMNLWNCDAETLKTFSPKVHCLFLFTVWISPYHGFKDQMKWAGPILRASFCKVFSDVKLRQSILRITVFGAVFGSLKSHAASRGGVDKMLEEVGDKLLVNIRHLCRRSFNPRKFFHRRRYMKDFLEALKRFLQRETEAREEMARRQAGSQGADTQMLGLLAQLMGAGMGRQQQQQQSQPPSRVTVQEVTEDEDNE